MALLELVLGPPLRWAFKRAAQHRAATNAKRLQMRRAAFAGELGEEAFVEATGGTECCPHCQTWTWQVGGWAKVEPSPTDLCLDQMTCKKCGKTSQWLYGPGCFFLIDPDPKSLPVPSDPETRE